ncbi:MAG TPA: cell division protein [Sphingomicrobium sp.]|nr:cell division protein [Sphingomicrobium sp.]
MRPGILTASEAERRLLPGGTLRSPTPYVIAIMTFAMMIVAAAGLALANAASVVAGAVEHRYVLQLPDGDRLGQAVAAARATPGVAAVEPVPEQEMRRTLERWIGPGGLGSELPVPALVHLDLAAGADPGAVGAALRRTVPGGRFIAERATVQPLVRSLTVLQWLALALVTLIAAATSAAVVLAARGALDTHRSTIEIMHGIGATDEQVTALFQRKIALDAMAGAAAGGAASAIILVLVGSGGAALAGELAGRPPLGSRDLAILALMPVAAVALATLVARLAVLRALRKAP